MNLIGQEFIATCLTTICHHLLCLQHCVDLHSQSALIVILVFIQVLVVSDTLPHARQFRPVQRDLVFATHRTLVLHAVHTLLVPLLTALVPHLRLFYLYNTVFHRKFVVFNRSLIQEQRPEDFGVLFQNEPQTVCQFSFSCIVVSLVV